MEFDKIYGVLAVSDLARARGWYAKLFGREPDSSPMPGLHEWHEPMAGIQVIEDAESAGRSMVTLVVFDLDIARSLLADRGLALGETSGGDFALVARIDDPDGNRITFAQPGKRQD